MLENKLTFLNKKTQKPLRYIGGEINSVVKPSAPVNMLLAFPDVYEIGMSHYGSRILYELINYNSDYSIERVYMPWKDAFSDIKQSGSLLCSIESNKKFKEFDIVGFSMQNELCYTNVLAMLDMGGVEIFSSKRGEKDPIIIAGGGATYNPAPMVDFIDAFVIGEADELIFSIFKTIENIGSRKQKLLALSKLRGIYVPSVHGDEVVVEKAVLQSLDDTPVIKNPLVPYMELVHDRITYEIQRGCARGCRFCQAGMIYRPVRQKNPDAILKMVEQNISDTGYRNIGFLSLNACDYPPLLKLVNGIYERFKDTGMFVSLPSLRIESISPEFLNVLSKLPKSGFTIAPEAGSQRIRKVINKDVTDEEIFETVRLVSGMNWDSIKTYFMIGLPTETDEDVEAIVELAHKIERLLVGKRCRLSVSISNFVPKPHTPFQWEKQLCWEEFNKKIQFLLSKIKGKKLSVKWGDAKMSEVEGVLCRGDKKIGELIYSVYKKGEMFTSWGSEFDYSKWETSMKELGIDKYHYLGEKKVDSKLPWDNISCGVGRGWLKKEKEKALEMGETKSCTTGDCSTCGVCQSYNIKNIITDNSGDYSLNKKIEVSPSLDKKFRIRAILSKESDFRWMGHFEFMDAVEKALLRSKIPVVFSKGFKPVSEVSYAPPVGVGVESLVEPADFYMFEYITEEDLILRLNASLPKGLKLKKAWQIPLSAPSLYQDIKSVLWMAIIPINAGSLKPLNDDDLWKNKTVEVERKGGIKQIRLSDFVMEFNASNEKDYVKAEFRLKLDQGKTIKPIEFLNAVFENLDKDAVRLVRRGMDINGVNFNY